jgi:hypothetical protein
MDENKLAYSLPRAVPTCLDATASRPPLRGELEAILKYPRVISLCVLCVPERVERAGERSCIQSKGKA